MPGGAKIRGMNIAPPPAAFVDIPVGVSVWSRLWGDCWDLDDWIIPNLDRIASHGCNVVRAMGSLVGILNDDYDRATYLSRWDDFNAAAANRGLYIYPCAQPGTHSSEAELASAEMLAEMLAFTEHVHEYRTCIGIDVVQELHAWASSAPATTLMNSLREVTDLPLTYSFRGTDSVLPTNVAKRDDVRDKVDFFDLHWYYSPAADGTDMETYYWADGETKPVLIGEFGDPLSAGSAAQNLRYRRIRTTINATGASSGRRTAGGIQWVTTDWQNTDPTDQWGAYDIAGVERTYLTDVIEEIAKT